MCEAQVWSLGREDLLEEERLPTPVFLLGESQGQRSLVGYSLWGHEELDTTEWLTLSCSFLHDPEFLNGHGGAVLMCTEPLAHGPRSGLFSGLYGASSDWLWSILCDSAYLSGYCLSVNQLLNPQLCPGSECGQAATNMSFCPLTPVCQVLSPKFITVLIAGQAHVMQWTLGHQYISCQMENN